MANPTTNLSIVLPEPGAEATRGTWGTTINDAFQDLDTVITARSMPTGGTDNQVLTKDGNLVDYQTEWSDRLSSVAVTGSDGIEVDSGSPITSSGTIALGIHKTTLLTFLNAEDGATSDQTNTEIRTAVEAASDSNVFTDVDHSKLNAIEALADVTDATNVNAAGALLHTDVPDSDTGFIKRTGSETYDIDTATYLTANQTITASGDAAGSGTTSIALTLANSGVTAASYGSSSAIPVITFDAKGRATTATTAAFTATTEADVVALAIALG
jgi:hypothetical protein